MAKIVLITGSNGGVGTALCNGFKNRGYEVVGLDIQSESAHSFIDDYLSIDLYRLVNEEAFRRTVASRLQGVQPNILINNAAVQLLGNVETLSIQDWRATFSVNVDAAFVLSQMYVPALKAKRGQIINIGSIHHKLSKEQFFAYATSKAALIGLTKHMATAIGKDVRVNAISPAAVHTAMLEEGLGHDKEKIAALKKLHPSQCIASPDELAAFVLEVAENTSPFLNGANIPFDGGIGNALLDIDAWE